MPQLAPELPRLRKLLLVGGGPLLEHYRAQVGASALGPRSVLTGDVPQVLEYAWAMDVGCLTPGSNEGFSNAVIEQMAAGLPMIVTDVGGNAEAVAARGERLRDPAPAAARRLRQALRRSARRCAAARGDGARRACAGAGVLFARADVRAPCAALPQLLDEAPGAMRDAISCAVSGFAGMEREILRLRNTNRDNPETAAYLSWRYESAPGAPAPLVYWLLAEDGERIGMAAAIFRSYWVHGARTPVAVIGDISLDTRWRGRGLGEELLRFMTQHLDEHYPAHAALVIPTESARRALERVGWVAAGNLAPLVYVVDAARYLQPFTRSAALARAVARVIRACLRPLIERHAPHDGTLKVSDLPDTSIREAVRAQAAAGVATRDLNAQVLGWRYTRHPHTAFRFATLKPRRPSRAPSWPSKRARTRARA